MSKPMLTDEAFALRQWTRAKRRSAGWRAVCRVVAVAAVIWAVFHWVLGLAIMSGTAMAPGIQDGSLVLYLKLPGTCRQGDVVMAEAPDGSVSLRRIAAVAGDVVAISAETNTVTVNGRAEDGDHAVGATLPRTADGTDMKCTVPPGQVFLLGDARTQAVDSRDYGAVDTTSIRGRVLAYGTGLPLDWIDWLIGLVLN